MNVVIGRGVLLNALAIKGKCHALNFALVLPQDSIKQRPEENTTAYILRFLSEAKLAYPTACAMGEEGKVVSFLKGFTDRAFAGHLLRTVQVNTLGTSTEVALEKEAEQKKEHQVMNEEPTDKPGVGIWVSVDTGNRAETHGATTGLHG